MNVIQDRMIIQRKRFLEQQLGAQDWINLGFSKLYTKAQIYAYVPTRLNVLWQALGTEVQMIFVTIKKLLA